MSGGTSSSHSSPPTVQSLVPSAGNGFGFGLVTERDIARTLSARYHKDGSEILIAQNVGRVPRRLTPRECARLMGYPEDFKIVVSDTQAYRQFGNSVVVPVVAHIAHSVAATLLRPVDYRHDLVLTLNETANVPRDQQVPVNYFHPTSVKLSKSKKATNKQSTP